MVTPKRASLTQLSLSVPYLVFPLYQHPATHSYDLASPCRSGILYHRESMVSYAHSTCPTHVPYLAFLVSQPLICFINSSR
jgi:hypothetical protein